MRTACALRGAAAPRDAAVCAGVAPRGLAAEEWTGVPTGKPPPPWRSLPPGGTGHWRGCGAGLGHNLDWVARACPVPPGVTGQARAMPAPRPRHPSRETNAYSPRHARVMPPAMPVPVSCDPRGEQEMPAPRPRHARATPVPLMP
eukprot:gene11042-biopygen12373